MNKASNTEPIINSQLTEAERNNFALDWINGVKQLQSLSKSRTCEAITIGTLYNIEECAGLGIPIKSLSGEWGLRCIDIPEGGFALVPLVQSDSDLHSYFAKQMSGPSYQEGCRAIFLPPDRLSLVWRGLILVHEVNHAMRHQDRTYRGLKLDHWIEEYETYIEEIELVQEIYKQPYIKAAHQLSLDFEGQLKKGQLHLNVGEQATTALLEDLFGKAESALEKNMQRGVFIFSALYAALDRLHLDGDKQEHYKITEWFTTSALNKNQV